MSRIDQTPGFLADMRSNDPARVNAAYERLTDELIAHARRVLGRRQDQVNCQAESVVGSVNARELGKGPESFKNERHLQARLRLAVTNEIIDRIKGPKGQTGQVSQYTEDGLPDPAQNGPGAGTQIAEAELADSLADLLTDGLDAKDKEIVLRAVLDDQDANEVSRHVALKPAAIRKRLERLRPDLRKRLLEPLRDTVSAQEWAVVNACLVERLDPKAAAELLGLTPEQMARTLETVMMDHLSQAIGKVSVVALGRLLGRVNSPSPPAGGRSSTQGGEQ